METIIRNTTGKMYNKCLQHFRSQFEDVVVINKVYINEDNQVYAGEWVDSKGVINFNAGFAPDAKKVVEFK